MKHLINWKLDHEFIKCYEAKKRQAKDELSKLNPEKSKKELKKWVTNSLKSKEIFQVSLVRLTFDSAGPLHLFRSNLTNVIT